MKKIHTILILLIMFSFIYAEGSFEIHHPESFLFKKKSSNLKEFVFDDEVINKTNEDITVIVSKKKINGPKDWEAYFCTAEFCYSTDVDEIEIDIKKNSQEVLQFHIVFTEVDDSVNYEVTVKNKDDEDDKIDITFKAATIETPIKFSTYTAANNSFIINPLKKHAFVVQNSLKQSFTPTIYSLNGKEVLSQVAVRKSTPYKMTMDISKLSVGQYILTLDSDNKRKSILLSKSE